MTTKDKILKLELLLEKVEQWKKEGKRIVFTNGCFDILHLGHIDYLEKARNLGDILIVGINTDASVQKLKGETRPVVNEYPRARMLAAMAFIDAVTFFDQDTPYELIEAIIPDILVKGNDYTVENIVGSDIVIQNGGKVATIDLVEGFSTTKII